MATPDSGIRPHTGAGGGTGSPGQGRLRRFLAAPLLVALGCIGPLSFTAAGGAETSATVPVWYSQAPSEKCSSNMTLTAGTLQGYIDAAELAQTHGETVCLSPGATLTVGSTATVTAPAFLNFNGATISKEPRMAGWVLSVLGPKVSVLNLDVDGNEQDGAQGGGISWQGSNGFAWGDHVFDTATDGVQVTGAGASLLAERSSSDDNVNVSLTGDGFFAGDGALLDTVGTSAEGNDRSGYFLARTAPGTSINGTSSFNRFAGLMALATDDLQIPQFTSVDDWHYGLFIGGDSNDCSIGQLQIRNTGIAQGALPTNPYGAGIEFFGATGCRVDSIIDTVTYKATSGYGVAIARQGTGTRFAPQGSDHNVFVSITVSGTANPAIDITGTSSSNTIGSAVAIDCAVGVNIGEGTVDNDDNVFDHLLLEDDWLAGLGIESSNGNVFRQLQLLNVGSRYRTVNGNAAIRLMGTAADNAFGDVDVALGPIPSAWRHSYRVPLYIVYGQGGTVDNTVRVATLPAASYASAPFMDHGSNRFVG